MGRTALTTEDRDAFRAQLRDVATKRFAKYGESGVTMRALADELGCSPMTPYRYVRDRDEVFAMVRIAANEAFAAAQERAALGVVDPVERMRALGRAYVAFALEYPDQYRVMFQLELHGDRDIAEIAKLDRRTWGPMRAAVVEAIETGRLDGDPEVIAHACWAAVHGLVSLHLAGKLRRDHGLSKLLEPTLELVLAGAGAKPSHRKRSR